MFILRAFSNNKAVSKYCDLRGRAREDGQPNVGPERDFQRQGSGAKLERADITL